MYACQALLHLAICETKKPKSLKLYNLSLCCSSATVCRYYSVKKMCACGKIKA